MYHRFLIAPGFFSSRKAHVSDGNGKVDQSLLSDGEEARLARRNERRERSIIAAA